MIEIAATVAGLLGLNARNLVNAALEVRKRKAKERGEERVAERKRKEALYVNQANVTNVLVKYYAKTKETSDLTRYSVSVDGKMIDTTVFTAKEFISLQEDCKEEVSTKVFANGISDSSQQAIPQVIIDYAPEVIERLEAMGVQLWDSPLYRLLEVSNDPKLSIEFGMTRFFSYRFTSGLLADELTDALVSTDGSIEEILVNSEQHLPVREVIMPSSFSIGDYKSRICSGGIATLLAFARPSPYNDYYIPLQIRSNAVSDGRNQLAVVPKAFHEPIVGHDEESSLYCTLIREVYEEIYGHKEVEQAADKLKHDWFVEKEPGVAWLHHHHGGYVREVVSFGLNAVGGNYDFGILLAVPDTWYWTTYGESMCKNWEADRLIWFSSKDTDRIRRLLTGYNWVNESIPPFVNGLLRLKQLSPKMVMLPDIQTLFVK